MPRRVLIYLAEKGITDIELVNVDLMKGEQKAPEFLAKNPMGSVPVLELDDGAIITESTAIMAYFEAQAPLLGGNTPMEQARIAEMNSLVMFSVVPRVARIFRNTHPMFKGRTKQFPEIAATEKASLPNVMEVMENKLSGDEFLVTPFASIADCSLYAVNAFATERAELAIIDSAKTPKLQKWLASFSKRPSVSFGS